MLGDSSYFGSDSMLGSSHYVNPHWVSSYIRSDGTFVNGYWRDGDGDTSIDRYTGYFAGNPTKRTYTVDDLTFSTGDDSFWDTLSLLFWGSLGALGIAAKIDEDNQKRRNNY